MEQKVRKKSYHPGVPHLYMVSAKKGGGTYACLDMLEPENET